MVNGCSKDPKHSNEKVSVALLDEWLFDIKNQFEGYKTFANGKITELEQAISLLKTENSNLKQKIEVLESNSVSNDNNNTNNNTNSSGWAAIVAKGKKKSNDQSNLLLAASKETKEQIEKEKNVIIHGLKLSTKTEEAEIKNDDKMELDKVLNAMKFDKSDKIKSYYRLKTNSKPEPLIVVFDNLSTRNYALKLSKNLADTEYKKKVFVNPDMTEAQRINFKRLWLERNEKNDKNDDKDNYYYGIRNDKVVKLAK